MKYTTLALLLAPLASAHNWMTFPTPMEGTSQAAMYGENSGQNDNCKSKSNGVPNGNTFKRGETIKPEWTWNNHWGGFIRFSVVPVSQQDDVEAMNDPNNFIKISCHTQNCGGPGTGFDDNGIRCNTDLTWPTHLEDGEYVLQWQTYGIQDSQGNPDKALPFYRACATIAIQGGDSLTDKPTDGCGFKFDGGDLRAKDPSDKGVCRYFKWNSLSFDQADQSIYNPKGLWVNGGNVVDKNAGTDGPPAEVEQCNGNVGASSLSSGSSSSSSSSSSRGSSSSKGSSRGSSSSSNSSSSSSGGRRRCRRRLSSRNGHAKKRQLNNSGRLAHRVRSLEI